MDTMKIEIDYNGAFAVCNIELMDEPGKIVNFDQIQELSKESVIKEWSFDISRTPTISVTLNDNHTIVEDNGWLVQDTEGRWWGMDSGYHRMLEEYQKIKMED